MNTFYKRVVLVGMGIVISMTLGALALGSAWPTPGEYLVRWIFPPSSSAAPYDPRTVFAVHIGANTLCCFSILLLLYLLAARQWRGK
jgi:hypothetical protein